MKRTGGYGEMAFAGILMLIVGLILFREAYVADLHHTVVPASGVKASWMSPVQGYVAAALCISFGVFAVIMWLWKMLAK